MRRLSNRCFARGVQPRLAIALLVLPTLFGSLAQATEVLASSGQCNPTDLIKGEIKPYVLVNLITSYISAAAKFDPPTWSELWFNGGVPHISHNRPYYLVEVVPRPASSPTLSIISPLLKCVYNALDEAFLKPLDEAITGQPRLYDPLQRGNAVGSYFYDVHVWRFVLDPLNEIISDPMSPDHWGNPANWFVGGIKPCYFSELDPFRWRYGVKAMEPVNIQDRFWEGWKSPDVDAGAQGRAMKFFPLGPLNDPSGHVPQVNPVAAAIVAGLRGIENGVDDVNGWGAWCADPAEERLLVKVPRHYTFDPIDTEGRWPGSTFDPDHYERNIDLHVQLIHPYQVVGMYRPIPVGWTDVLAGSNDPDVGEYERAPYWYTPTCFDPPCEGKRSKPKSSDGYVFLVWLRHDHTLGKALANLTWEIVKTAIQSVTGIPIDKIEKLKDSYDLAKEMKKKAEQMIDDIKQIPKRIEKTLGLVDTMATLAADAAKPENMDGTGQLINGAIIAAAKLLDLDPADEAILSVECVADTAWETLEILETVSSLSVCGKGLTSVREIQAAQQAIEDAKAKIANVMTKNVVAIFHSACGLPGVHPAILDIHAKTDPETGTLGPKLAKAKKFIQYGDVACAGGKFLIHPTSDPVELLAMFGRVAPAGLGPIGDLAAALGSFKNPKHAIDDALSSLSAAGISGTGGLSGSRVPGLTNPQAPALPVSPAASRLPTADIQWWQSELTALKGDLQSIVTTAWASIEEKMRSLTRGDFVKVLARPLEKDLKDLHGRLKGAGKSAVADKDVTGGFDDIQKQGKMLVEQVKILAGLFDPGSLSKDHLMKGLVAMATIQVEFQNLTRAAELSQRGAGANRNILQTAAQELQAGLTQLVSTIRTLDTHLEAEIMTDLAPIDPARIQSVVARLRAIEQRAKSSPADKIPQLVAMGSMAGTSAQALTDIAARVSALSGQKGQLFSPLRPALNDIADQLGRLPELLEALLEATGAMEDYGGTLSANAGGASEAMGGPFSVGYGAPPGQAGFAKFLALLGGAARKSRLPTDYITNIRLANADALAAQPQPAQPTSPPPPVDATTFSEKFAKRTITPREDEKTGTPPEQKARGAWEQKMRDVQRALDIGRDPSIMTPEECRSWKQALRLAFRACQDNAPDPAVCKNPDDVPCNEQ